MTRFSKMNADLSGFQNLTGLFDLEGQYILFFCFHDLPGERNKLLAILGFLNYFHTAVNINVQTRKCYSDGAIQCIDMLYFYRL